MNIFQQAFSYANPKAENLINGDENVNNDNNQTYEKEFQSFSTIQISNPAFQTQSFEKTMMLNYEQKAQSMKVVSPFKRTPKKAIPVKIGSNHDFHTPIKQEILTPEFQKSLLKKEMLNTMKQLDEMQEKLQRISDEVVETRCAIEALEAQNEQLETYNQSQNNKYEELSKEIDTKKRKISEIIEMHEQRQNERNEFWRKNTEALMIQIEQLKSKTQS